MMVNCNTIHIVIFIRDQKYRRIDLKIAEKYQGLPQTKIHFTDYFFLTYVSTLNMKSRNKKHKELDAEATKLTFTFMITNKGRVRIV